MIKIYTSPSCSSCRKVKQWLKDKNILFNETNILAEPLVEKDIKELLFRTENGTDDILSKRSKIMKKGINIDNLTISELIKFIKENPTILKRPIIVDERRLQVGFHKEDIRAFIPEECRNADNCFNED